MTLAATIRRLSESDAEAWRTLRLEGLKRHPEAFGASLEQEAAQPLRFFVDRMTRWPIWGAFQEDGQGGGIVGSVGFFVHDAAKQKHKGMLWGLYVREAWRGHGVARALIGTVIEHARHEVEILQLTVAADNRPAGRLYDRMGFLPYGLERHALKIDGRYYDEELRARFLAEPGHPPPLGKRTA